MGRWPVHPRGSRSFGRKVRVSRSMAHNPGPNMSSLQRRMRVAGSSLGQMLSRAGRSIKSYHQKINEWYRYTGTLGK